MSIPLILPYTTQPFIPTPAFPNQNSVTRPLVVTTLEYNSRKLPFSFGSVIDSGADYCMFPAQFGESAGIDVRSGKLQSTTGIGSDTAYFHQIKVFVEINGTEYWFPCWAGFMYSLDGISIGLLGRHGFFGLFESITFKKDQIELIPKVPKVESTAPKPEPQSPTATPPQQSQS